MQVDNRFRPVSRILTLVFLWLAAIGAASPDSLEKPATPDQPQLEEELSGRASAETEPEKQPGTAGEETQDKAAEKIEPYSPSSDSPKARVFARHGKDALVYRLVFTGTVDMGMVPFIARVIDQAQAADAVALVVEMDTPGGRVDAAVKIKNAILEARIPTILFINKEAISAGALIGLAHDYIVWSEGGTMGAATPILMDGNKVEDAGEKMVSYMRGVMRATAEAKDRDGLVAEAMVDADVVVPGFSPAGKLLTVSYEEAESLGLLDFRADNMDELLGELGLEGAEVVTIEQNWAETVARFLTHPVVSSLLMSFGFLGLLLEFHTAGFGIMGIIGILCLVLFFVGHSVVLLAGWEAILLFAVGLVLMGLEVFVIPGFGVAGVVGILALGAALVMSLIGLDFSVALSLGLVEDALVQVFIAVILSGLGTVLGLRYLPSLKPVNKLILKETLTSGQGCVANDQAPPDWLHREVEVLTDLRPVGTGRIDGNRVELITRGEMIRKGQIVRVVAVEGGKLVVRLASEMDSDASQELS